MNTGFLSATIPLSKKMKTIWFSTRKLGPLDVCTNGSLLGLTESTNFNEPVVKDNR